MVAIGHRGWSYTLFTKYPKLFLPILQNMRPQSQAEVARIARIFEKFKVSRDSKILDLSCGIGRHSIGLVKKGYQVVGYDISACYLQVAKERAAEEIPQHLDKVRFYQGDMNQAAEVLSKFGEPPFGAVIIMFNSLGYLSETMDIHVLKNIRNIAGPKCVLVTETDNRDWWFRNFQKHNLLVFNDLEIHQSWNLNLETSVVEGRWKFYERTNLDKSLRLRLDLPVSLRLYSLHELIRILKISGWKYVSSYGGTRSYEPVSYESRDILAISQSEKVFD